MLSRRLYTDVCYRSTYPSRESLATGRFHTACNVSLVVSFKSAYGPHFTFQYWNFLFLHAKMLLSSISFLGLVIGSSAWTCYTPDGVDRNSGLNGTLYAPCDNTAKFSMCCRINDSSPGANGNDTCLPSGMCYNGASRETWRESCTDKTWRSGSCQKLFVNGTSLDSSSPVANPREFCRCFVADAEGR